MIRLPEKAALLISQLESHGHEAFIVGGCVRDGLLGRAPNDWDICTSASPEEMKRCFSNLRVIETGLKHGTLTVLAEGEPFEITTYRIDGEYSDSRHPDQVLFTSDLREDLSRRDFTINAMAWHPQTGLVDPFGGARDLKRGIIRCVGKPEKRFREDALRIMRAVRFAGQLGFRVDAETDRALYQCCPLLDKIAAERMRMELDKLLCGAAAEKALRDYREIIAHFIPEIRPMFGLDQKNRHHIYTVWEHTLRAVSQIPDKPLLRLCAFFHDIGKPGSMTVDEDGCGHFYQHEILSEGLAGQAMKRLKYDNDTRETVLAVIRSHSVVFRPDSKQARRLLGKLGEERLRLLIELELADVKSQNPLYREERVANIAAFREKMEEVLAEEQCFSLRHLAINGRDLLCLGIPQGPEIGRILNVLLEQVVEEALPNEPDALKEAARKV